jgi:ATP-dependent Lhr-like helicase
MDLLPEVDDSALDVLKFSECLPKEMALHMLQMRLRDADSLAKILSQKVCYASK